MARAFSLEVAQSSGGLAATLVRGLTAEGEIPSLRITDWKSYTIQPEYMAAGVQLHALALQEVAGVCGLPAARVPGAAAAGPGHREAFRQFVALTVQPLGRILKAEVSRVLERPVRLRHHDLASADVAARARAFKALIDRKRDAVELRSVGTGESDPRKGAVSHSVGL